VIGWSNGDLSVVDQSGGGCELWHMHAHVHAVNMLALCGMQPNDDSSVSRDDLLVSDDSSLVSLVSLAADNYLKLWSVDRSVSGIIFSHCSFFI